MNRVPVVFTAAAITTVGMLASARCAQAAEHSIIRDPGDHPTYVFEAEPHGLLGFGAPFNPDEPLGVGFRGTFHIADGFVKSINDSVGVGVGLDFAPGPGQARVLVPVVLQWNFWLSTHWSVFGEPGVAFTGGGPYDYPLDPFILYVGGRYHFSEKVALTLRAGYPDFSVGASFFL